MKRLVVKKKLPGRFPILVAYAAILIYLVAVVFFSYQDGQTKWAKYAAVLLAGTVVLLISLKGRLPTTPRPIIWLACWIIWVAISSFFAIDQSLAFSKFLTVCQITLAGYVICVLVVLTGRPKIFGYMIITVALANAIYVYLFPTGLVALNGRVNGTLGNANLFSLLLVAGIVYALAYSVGERLIGKALLLSSTVILFFEVLQTGSRKGMLGSIFVGGTVFFIANHYGKRGAIKSTLIPILLTGGLLLGATTYLLLSQHAHRVEQLTNFADTGDTDDLDKSAKDRFTLMTVALHAIGKHPIFGVGIDNFRLIRYKDSWHSIGAYAHNNYLEIATTTGVLGLFIYLMIYVNMAKRLNTVRKAKLDSDAASQFAACVGMVLVFVLFDLAMVSYSEKLTWILLGGLIGQIYSFRRSSAIRR